MHWYLSEMNTDRRDTADSSHRIAFFFCFHFICGADKTVNDKINIKTYQICLHQCVFVMCYVMTHNCRIKCIIDIIDHTNYTTHSRMKTFNFLPIHSAWENNRDPSCRFQFSSHRFHPSIYGWVERTELQTHRLSSLNSNRSAAIIINVTIFLQQTKK